MQFINEEDHIVIFLQLAHERFHTLLELSSVLGARYERGQVERDDPLVEEHPGNLPLDDPQGKSLSNGRFSHTRLSYEQWVVLFLRERI